MSELHEPLLTWYEEAKRDLPWRQFKDPYAIWVSEVMLQQTTVATVAPRYVAWMSRFPTVESLAASTEEEALAQWEGLGYYRRCRMLRQGAQWVAENGMPTNAKELRLVPGIGPYTAGAIASIAFGEAAPVVDANVARVYARLQADDSIANALSKAAWAWAEVNMHGDRPGDWNQALMELGALVCVPKKPRCAQCPISGSCAAFRIGETHRYPKAAKRPDLVLMERHAALIEKNSRLALEKIPEGEWWQGMWTLPVEPTKDALAERFNLRRAVTSVRHRVTRHDITLHVHEAEGDADGARWVTEEELEKIALPSPMRKAIKKAKAQQPALL